MLNLKKRFPHLLWLFCCFSFVLFFEKPISDLLNNILVEPLFSRYTNGYLSNSVLIVLSAGLCYWIWNYGSREFARTLAAIVAVFYLVMLSSGDWKFQYSMLIPFVRNWDFIVIAIVLPVAGTLLPEKHITTDEQAHKGFIEDKAIISDSQDSFRRSQVARQIAQKIGFTYNKQSFAIGILGEYGSGKTSFINLIKLHLDKDKTAIIDFNPWSADQASNIQRDFFDLLASRLYEINPRISGMLVDYARKLSRLDSSVDKSVKQLGLASNLFFKSSSVDDFEKINALLAASGKKIVITIDDLDRLYHDEVMEVLRMIRNTANFNNIFYLVAYERSFIEEAIRSLNENAGTSFIDKIMQLEIPLPKREGDDLLDALEANLETFLTAEHLAAYRAHIVKTGFRFKHYFSFERVFRQSRDVIKFVNNFKLTYELIGPEVMFDSLFVLELLKFRFPLIYDRLYERRDEFVRARPSRASHDEFYELRTYRVEKEDKALIGKTLAEENEYSASDIELISGLISNLFFGFDQSRNTKNSIIYPMFFERYFRYRLSSKEISERQFLEAWNSGLTPVREYVDKCAEQGVLDELSDRLFQVKTVKRSDYELKLEALFYLGPQYIKKKGPTSYDYESLTRLVWNYDNNIEKRYYKKAESEFPAFLDKLLSEARFPYMFANEFIFQINKGSKTLPLSQEKLNQFQAHYFTEFVRQNGLSKDAVWMFWWARLSRFDPLPEDPSRGYETWFFIPQVIPVIKRVLPLYDPFQFLKISIKYDMRNSEIYFIHKEILDIFDEPEDFRKIIAEHTSLDEAIKEDYLRLFDACKEKEFKDWAIYEFRTNLKPERTDYDEY